MSGGGISEENPAGDMEGRHLLPPNVSFAVSPRRPNSIRRTTTHDAVRSEGLRGPVTVVGRGGICSPESITPELCLTWVEWSCVPTI
jgi:hypothetical protein